ncbi:MAG: peptide chain release factor N(5)-glutamine methyltransferase [Candidatus Margulisbacteria bacterium]|nr:peptide chain release factor N(5)-glutamine methyltransferase [Candidatus Margulisiibacteriota bacterium]
MIDAWSVNKTLDWTTNYFKDHGIEWPHLEAEILLAHSLNVKRIQLYVQHEKVLSSAELARFRGYIERRVKHEPIAYITGCQPFMGLDFIVTRDTLIPRPETEKLVELAIDIINSRSSVVSRNLPAGRQESLVDLGTGSGAIAVSLAKYLPQVKIIGIDISSAALEVAKQNAVKHNVVDRCRFIRGNMFEPLQDIGRVDLIISNPPYIPTKVISTLTPDVKDFEPISALDGGEDGLDYIRKLIDGAPNCLKPKGLIILEFGDGQAEKVRSYTKDKFGDTKIIRDPFDKERIFLGQNKSF